MAVYIDAICSIIFHDQPNQKTVQDGGKKRQLCYLYSVALNIHQLGV